MEDHDSPAIFPIPAFNDNYIWCILDNSNKTCAVVDPGDGKPVLEVLQKKRLTLDTILITHHHYDHTNGINELLQHYQLKIYGPANEPLPHVDCKVKEKDQIWVHDKNFEVISIPGHTRGHVAYYGSAWVFCGDTLFTAGCGKIFEGTPQQMYTSLMKLANLPDTTLIYCGHEYTLKNLEFAQEVEPHNPDIQNRIIETKKLRDINLPSVPAPLALEKKTNPFLRCQQPSVIDAVAQHYQKKFTEPVEVFSHLREWKNNFTTP